MKPEEFDHIRKVLFWVFLVIFLLTALSALAAFLKAHGLFGQTYEGDKSLIKYLLGAVVVEVSILIFALWKGLFNPSNNELSTPEMTTKFIDATGISSIIIQLVTIQLLSGDLHKVGQYLVKVRERFPEIVSDDLLFLEASIRSLMGHGHFIESIFGKIDIGTGQGSVISYEQDLLRYADNEKIQNFKSKKLALQKQNSRLWNSLYALECISENKIKEAELYFQKIDHNISDETPVLNETDNYVAYSALQNAIVAAALGKPKIAEKYFDIARQTFINIEKFKKNEYPFVLLIAKLHRCFVNRLLGFDEALPKEYIKSISGHARVVARHCRIFAESKTAVNTIVEISKNWGSDRKIEPNVVRKRLYQFQKELVSNSDPVYTGVSAKLVSH